tara:strand:+ start:68 stop:682 length:615 start_codon:yes stop_codon:yes gene_type:complete
MIIIGITGSIGMGKTTIARMLKKLSIPVFDSDREVKNILEDNNKAKSQINKIWPNVIIEENKRKKIDKVLLSKIIFNDKINRKKLEKIIHPLVKKRRDVFIKNNHSSPIIALDVPLLYETGTDRICDEVFLTYTNESKQKQRVLARANMNEEMFNSIKRTQWNTEKKKKKKPYLVTTTYGKLTSFLLIIVYLIVIVIKKKVLKL